jgi:transcriptional regulator with XRE-family HTH domain
MDGRERLIEIMKSQGLNAKQFSQALGISPGTISNIISGRNKPSLELLQNVAATFSFIQSDWLFLGKGDMHQPGYEPVNHQISDPDLFSQMEEKPVLVTQPSTTSNNQSNMGSQSSVAYLSSCSRTIQKIVIFYSDGTFEER